MTKAKHTPGPWFVGDSLVGGQLPVGPHERMQVATVPLYAPVAGVNGTSGEIEANARLVAAAPALLEALRTAADLMPIDGTTKRAAWHAAARAALRDAEDEA